ncbi:MAG: VCBS repeat-containing protein, partial [Candidatus Saccharimonas sp.]|nr:VCBS repeat-containing protein [Planctomycetaceae bacterium]
MGAFESSLIADCKIVSFAAATTHSVGATPTSVAVGDFNGDGKADLVTANVGSHTVSVRLGNGLGGFGAVSHIAVGASSRNPWFVTLGDFNGDGKADLATANFTSDDVSVLLGNGIGGFGVATRFAVGVQPISVAVGDFNGDGKADLAATNYNATSSIGSVSVLLGNGIGGFTPTAPLSVGKQPRSVKVGDFNGDGKADLAVANFGSNTVSVLLGNGAGGFGTESHFAVGINPSSVAVGDFNGDGKSDLAVSNNGSANVSVLPGNGAGGFGVETRFAVGGTNPLSVTVGDFNGDGKADLATANYASNTVSVLQGNGTGVFAAPTQSAVGTAPYSVAVGDFNGDGQADLATANSGSANVSVLLNNSTCAPSDITLVGQSIPENSSTGSIVGSLSATDHDVGDTATFTLTNSAGGRFKISGSNLVVDNGGLLDFETNTS